MRSHLSFANVLSALALFIALGGGAYAASLPRNSVGTQQLKGNAVTSAKVKDGSLQRADFAAGQIPSVQGNVRGETGAVGPKGDIGATGLTGPKGDTGDTGAAGAAGAKGDKGDMGDTGAQGPHGLKGDTGATGPKGDTGNPGATGATGAQGLKGETGGIGPQGATGGQGPAGATGLGLGGFFGTGDDGDQVMSASTSLTRDLYLDDLTLNANVNLNTNGFRLFVAGTLTMNNNSRIHRNGNGAIGTSQGAALTARTLGAGGAGTQPLTFPNCISPGMPNSLGGSGGGGNCGAGGAAADPIADVGGADVLLSASQALTGRTLDGNRINGGAGGSSGGGTGGGGGGAGGAGVVVVAARTIVVSGTATMTAIGGSTSGGSDGGGGGGGVVVVVSTTPRPAGLTLAANGGTPGGTPGSIFYID